MSIAAAVLTYNALKTGRMRYLIATVDSLAGEADSLVLLDGGSTDDSCVLLRAALPGILRENDDGDTTIGHTMNLAIGLALASEPDIVLFSADDMAYYPGWAQRLTAFWHAAPPDVALCCLNLEPEYPWNEVREVLTVGDERALVRDSVPGSCWSFRASDWSNIGPLPNQTTGEDLVTCQKLRQAGRRLVALDLSDHSGAEHSAWGNQSWRYARPLDKEKWGL